MKVENKVKEILCELCGQESVDNTEHLQDELALDSLMMVTMLVEIEDVFGIELEEADMNPFDLSTVQNVIDMVAKYCGDEDE